MERVKLLGNSRPVLQARVLEEVAMRLLFLNFEALGPDATSPRLDKPPTRFVRLPPVLFVKTQDPLSQEEDAGKFPG